MGHTKLTHHSETLYNITKQSFFQSKPSIEIAKVEPIIYRVY